MSVGFGIFSPGAGPPPTVSRTIMLFSGELLNGEAPGAVHTFASNGGWEPSAPGANAVDPVGYPIPAITIDSLYACVPTGAPALSDIVFTVFKNGVATAITCTIPAGSAANTVAHDTAHTVGFAAGDRLDLRVSGIALMGGDCPFSANVSGTF